MAVNHDPAPQNHPALERCLEKLWAAQDSFAELVKADQAGQLDLYTDDTIWTAYGWMLGQIVGDLEANTVWFPAYGERMRQKKRWSKAEAASIQKANEERRLVNAVTADDPFYRD